ncbi:MAG: hypothetical protein HYV09_35265 [Deltaproteobacteria bacterium]|nr:hypothetical protein [Deltaproteobacteria bacterium]
MKPSLVWTLALVALQSLAGCAISADRAEDEQASVEYEQPFVSDVATLMDFEFDGELTTSVSTNLLTQIRAQLFYTVGHLNGEPGVSRLDRVKITNVTRTVVGGLNVVKYRVKLPVAWGSKTDLPTSYTLTLPRRIDAAGQEAFTRKYATICNDGDRDATVSNYWYHYRPKAWGCRVDAVDALTVTAKASVSRENSVAKYPEYHKVWEDSALTVVSIFGKYEDGATTSADAGVRAYDDFIAAVRGAFPAATTTPAIVPVAPGVATPDVTFTADLGGGRRLQIVALLVDNVRTAGPAFDARYAELSPGADLVLYNGHAGLGANVRALSQKGRFFPGKYQIFFMNGCDTFAYVDGALAQARASLNPDDPSGTKYMDIVTNAMPAYFNDMSEASMALIGALANPDAPRSYGAIFREVSAKQVVVATGEEDNVFNASYKPASKWGGFHASGAVLDEQSVTYQTDVLPAGRYVFAMTPEGGAPGGDADLFVRVGAAPTATATYKCKSYVYNSNERCAVTLSSPARVHMIAKGDKATLSKYRVDAFGL